MRWKSVLKLTPSSAVSQLPVIVFLSLWYRRPDWMEIIGPHGSSLRRGDHRVLVRHRRRCVVRERSVSLAGGWFGGAAARRARSCRCGAGPTPSAGSGPWEAAAPAIRGVGVGDGCMISSAGVGVCWSGGMASLPVIDGRWRPNDIPPTLLPPPTSRWTQPATSRPAAARCHGALPSTSVRMSRCQDSASQRSKRRGDQPRSTVSST